jgi:hypothetical protein
MLFAVFSCAAEIVSLNVVKDVVAMVLNFYGH